ncbi:type II toxin-antitoxin system RelE/ParE family toxin [Sphingobium yanoikuyae]|uniref:type II toxin-antitoxin system RelE/ParE family toxin n=1 Tax=Sphingobium yanoikuyae TaxID=13690 RepID=UPI001FE9DF25|nr:type II toxin-antitoxin system RelE/ParE family toxin [Sphingobium scionense]
MKGPPSQRDEAGTHGHSRPVPCQEGRSGIDLSHRRCTITLCVIYRRRSRRTAIARIFKNGWFERFARKERIADASLREAVQRAESGLVDADLGGGVIKQRGARTGQGKSGGYRTLILFKQGDRAIFAFGFAKSAQANISKADLALLRNAATEALEWSAEELDRLVVSGTLLEIDDGNDGEG